MMHSPEILAPAGDASSFLAAISAGADAVYCGLKLFSARMQADNFSIQELSRLTALAHAKGRRVYVTMNSLVKPDEMAKAGRLIDRLARVVKPDALIIQDLGMAQLAREAGFTGELHLSTLANVSSPTALAVMPALGISRVVLPRELNVDEMRLMADACPEGVSLETFVHGALCHNVSGRCYWSSFLGGKSSLRGRCVQPCRRMFATRKGGEGRFFSCQDLSLDILAKALLTIPKVGAWKIEGRKKGAHYVFYTVSAYRLLRDSPEDPQSKKNAMSYLEQALGRPTTHYGFLPQKTRNPVDSASQTGSGLLVGRLTMREGRKFFINPRVPLLAGDLLRLGYEDEQGHQISRVSRGVPKAGRYDITLTAKSRPRPGMSVFLIDRRETELTRRLDTLRSEMQLLPEPVATESTFEPKMPAVYKRPRNSRPDEIHVWRQFPKGPAKGSAGYWVSAVKTQHLPLAGRVAWPQAQGDGAVGRTVLQHRQRSRPGATGQAGL